MNTQTIPELRPDLAVINGQIKTTSLKIAEHFGKRHDDVLKRINNLDCSPEFNARNFAAVEYLDAKGEKRPAYEVTKDGFVFLAMGFTGKAAAQWKEAYINAFNEMERKLLPKEPPKPSIETFQVKILTVFTRGDEPTQQVVPYGSCIIDPDNPVQLKTFINEYIPVELMLDVINAASQKLARNLGRK